jgi:hypothetical protein
MIGNAYRRAESKPQVSVAQFMDLILANFQHYEYLSALMMLQKKQ